MHWEAADVDRSSGKRCPAINGGNRNHAGLPQWNPKVLTDFAYVTQRQIRTGRMGDLALRGAALCRMIGGPLPARPHCGTFQ